MSAQSTTVLEHRTRTASELLICGMAAGPLFIAVTLAQAFARPGFDLSRHPISLLSLGELGWLQIANFTACGLLYLTAAVGLRQVLSAGPGTKWIPRLVGAMGVGLVLAGVFVTDPGAGYPAGAPNGAPQHLSWHGVLHEVGALVSGVSWIAVCLVLRRRFARRGERGWACACVGALVAALAVTLWPHLDSLSVRLVVGTAVEFALLTAVFAREWRAASR